MAYRTRLDINNGQDLNFNVSNVEFVDGLTADKVKIRYNWFFNAKVLDAVIGENENGLVWYSGTWLCGDWWDGTWYSGSFNGRWRKGRFYSYLLDLVDVLKGKLRPLIDSPEYSTFVGSWESGLFYNGTFLTPSGNTWDDYYSWDTTGLTLHQEDTTTSVWIEGTFFNGIFIDSIWESGKFMNGTMSNTQWFTGYFYNGTFQGWWYGGEWKGGDFLYGYWNDGKFSQIDSNIDSQFCTLGTAEGDCTWTNGTFSNGKFLSGSNNSVSKWYNGRFESGDWHGGHFKMGEFVGGTWHGGIFGDYLTTDYSYCTSITQVTGATTFLWVDDYQDINSTGLTNGCKTSETDYLLTTYITNFVNPGTNEFSDILTFSGFTFSDINIPDGAEISDISVIINKDFVKIGDAPYDMYDNLVTISNGNITSDNKARDEWWSKSNSDEYHFDGSIFTPGDIQNGISVNFQSRFTYRYSVPSGSDFARIYSCSMKIQYKIKPYWRNGIWKNGYWVGGTFLNGEFNGGLWEGGNFKSGTLSD